MSIMRHSKASEPNEDVADWTNRYLKRNNRDFFRDALKALAENRLGNQGVGVIGLVGQTDLPGYTLRTAQSVLRWDRRPSLWSHAFLIAAPVSARITEVPIWEVALHPRSGEIPMPEKNGVGESRLGFYDDPTVDANVALLAVRMTDSEARKVVERARQPNIDRLRYSLWDCLGVWQSYMWSQAVRPNPLSEGYPICSSSYVEMAFEAIHLDLTPAASERNSAPEHLWNAALWWHEAYRDLKHPISGYYVHRNKQCYLRDAGSVGLRDHLGNFGKRSPRKR
jgi:hypothetical protein